MTTHWAGIPLEDCMAVDYCIVKKGGNKADSLDLTAAGILSGSMNWYLFLVSWTSTFIFPHDSSWPHWGGRATEQEDDEVLGQLCKTWVRTHLSLTFPMWVIVICGFLYRNPFWVIVSLAFLNFLSHDRFFSRISHLYRYFVGMSVSGHLTVTCLMSHCALVLFFTSCLLD